MRAHWIALALLAILALPGSAHAARDWWEGIGVGEAQESDLSPCTTVFHVGLVRQMHGSWYVHVELYALPNRFEVFGCLPRGYVFPEVSGGPDHGWSGSVTTPCATSTLQIGKLGALAAGLTEIQFYFGDFCNGNVERGTGRIAFMTPDA